MTFTKKRTYGVPEFAGTEVNQRSGKLKGLPGYLHKHFTRNSRHSWPATASHQEFPAGIAGRQQRHKQQHFDEMLTKGELVADGLHKKSISIKT